MAVERWVIDPVEEDAANVPLDLMAAPFSVLRASTPTPGLDPRWAQPSDADGDRLVATRYLNRDITISLQVVPTGASRAAAAQAALSSLAAKLAKINRAGGTLRRVLPSGDVITFDLLTADAIDAPWDVDWDVANVLSLDVKLTAKPFAREPEQARSVHTETTLPVLVFTETGIPGDVPALGRLVLTDGSGVDQEWATWGVQSRAYDPAATAALFYEAEALTPLGTAVLAAGPAGASGAGTNKVVYEANVPKSYRALLSTKLAGGSHLSHVGVYRVRARVQLDLLFGKQTSLFLEWAEGGYQQPIRNPAVTIGINGLDPGRWFDVDLGVVDLGGVPAGQQSWEGRIVARGDLGASRIYVDYLYLVPCEEGSGEARGVVTFEHPSVFLARDEYTSAGALTGKALQIGGTWQAVTGSDADDFVVTSGSAARTSVSDTGTGVVVGRGVLAGTTSYGACYVQTDFYLSAYPTAGGGGTLEQGVLLRYVDASNFARAVVSIYGGTTPYAELFLFVTIGGVETVVAGGATTLPVLNAWNLIRARIDAAGRIALWHATIPPDIGTVFRGQSDVFATGGTLASGKVGLYDRNSGVASSSTRTYANFLAAAPVVDAALFASQSLEVRSDAVVRESADGALWRGVSSYEGDYLLVPPSGPEGRSARFLAKAARNDPLTGFDTAIDDLSGQLFITPRHLVVP